MPRKRLTNGQIAFALRQAGTARRWTKSARRDGRIRADLFSLEEAVRRHGRAGDPTAQADADLTLDRSMLQDVLKRKW